MQQRESVMSIFRLAPLALLGALAACSPAPNVPNVTTPTPAEAGCLRDVATTTNNPEVTIISSFASEAGTEVTVGVGPDRAPWRCIGYSDGTTAAIMSLVDEGAL
jgi:hypothetical protein